MKTHTLLTFSAWLLVSLAAMSSGQDVRELWLPLDQLETLLKQKPRAVFLTPEQYQTLATDAARAQLADAEESLAPPLPGVVRSVEMRGEIVPGEAVVEIQATYDVEILQQDGWTEVPLPLPTTHLGRVTIDGEGALRVVGQKSPLLYTHGVGVHSVVAQFHLPVASVAGGEAIEIHSPGLAAASLQLELPEGAQMTSELPFYIDAGGRAQLVLPSDKGGCWQVAWTEREVPAIPGAAIFQTCSYLYKIDSTRVLGDLGVVINANLRDLPERFTMSLPTGAKVLSVDGVELAGWTRKGGGNIEVKLQSGSRRSAALRIRLESPIGATEIDEAVALPSVDIEGIHRSSGTLTILGSEDVRIKQIETAALTVPVPDGIDTAMAALPGYVASFQFPIQQSAPVVTLSGIRDRFTVALDTSVRAEREAIFVTRSASYIPIEGHLFSATVELPTAEELVAVTCAERHDFSWVEEDGTVILRWSDGLSNATPTQVKIESRRDPEGWYQLGEEPMELQLEPLLVAGAETVSGYLAVRYDSSFSIRTGQSSGLEPRDGRKTPVTGSLAWFRLDDYSLTLSATRRPAEIEAAITAYALPLANSLEIEGQISLAIANSGIQELTVQVDESVSQLVRFSSPGLTHQTRDEESGDWTLTFQDEVSGSLAVRYSINLPLTVAESENIKGKKRFAVSLPRLSVPAAKRTTGTWVVEANTDTEITFDTMGVDQVDSLQVPSISGYRPRHRVIAAYRYRDGEWGIDLAGTRHPHATIVSTVVDSLLLDTVVSTDGPARHQARLQVRSSGEQFLDVQLPAEAVLWSLLIDGERMKPVRSGRDRLRVLLSEKHADGEQAKVQIIYQTPGDRWRGSGREKLSPISVSAAIPVLFSKWNLYLPEGYDYQRFRSNLQQEFEIENRFLLGEIRVPRRFKPSEYIADRLMVEGNDSVPQSSLAPNERERMNYYDVARDHTRAAFLRQVAEGWESPVPQAIEPELGLGSNMEVDAMIRNEDLLTSIRIPSIEFSETPLRDALQFIQSKSVDLDPQLNGINIILDAPLAAASESQQEDDSGFGFGGGNGAAEAGGVGSTPITLKLSNVSLGEVLRYTTSLAQMKYKVEANAIVVVPLSRPDQELVMNAYTVPPGFLSSFSVGGGGPIDPFAAPDPDERPILKKMTAREVLENAGISFPPGATAIYNPATSQLIIKNTPDQMELVEAYQESIRSGVDFEALPLTPIVRRAVDYSISARHATEDKLRNLRLPSVEFADTPLSDAIAFLETKSAQLDPEGTGVPIIIEAAGVENVPVTLRLTNVPLAEALRYTTQLASVSYRVNSDEVSIIARHSSGEVVAHQYAAPPEFFQPLAEAPSVKEFFESAGITFGAGSSASYDASLGELTVKNTPNEMALVEAFLESFGNGGYVMDEEAATTFGVGVSAAPVSASIYPLVTSLSDVRALFEEQDGMVLVQIPLPPRVFQSLEGNTVKARHAKAVLVQAGVAFPDGASAVYDLVSKRLSIRNTQPNLEAVMTTYSEEVAKMVESPNAKENDLRLSEAFLGGAARLKGFEVGDIGRLPMEFDLPQSGRFYGFDGFYAPEPIAFRYVNWERQIRVAWLWICFGFLAFVIGAWRYARMPIFIGLLGGVLLGLLPLAITGGVAIVCNALLLGWLAGIGIWFAYALSRRIGRATALIALLILPVWGAAEESLAPHTVYVPYDVEVPLSEQSATRYYLDYDSFQKLWQDVKTYRQEQTGGGEPEVKKSYDLTSALYRVKSTTEEIAVSGRLALHTRGRGWQKVPLAFSGVSVESIRLNGETAAMREGAILVEEPGQHVIDVELKVPIVEGQDSAKWQVPQCSATLLEIKMDSEVAEPVLQGDWPLAERIEDGNTTYTAAIGQAGEVQFRRRLKTSAHRSTRPSLGLINARLFVAQGLEQLEAEYQLKFSGQEKSDFSISFDRSVTPVSFDIPHLSHWQIADRVDSGLRELSFSLSQPAQDSLVIRFAGERVYSAKDETASQRRFPHLSAEATRIEQRREILRANGIRIKADPGVNHRQITSGGDADGKSGFIPVSTFSLTGQDEALDYALSSAEAERSVVADYVFQVGAAKLETIAQFQVTSLDEPLLEMAFEIPADSKVQSVQGNRIREWWRTENDLFVRLAGETPEVTALLIHLTQEQTDVGAGEQSLAMGPFRVHGFSEEQVSGTGLVVAHTTRDVVIDFAEDRRVVREVGIDEVGSDIEVLPPMEKKRGFRFDRASYSGEVISTQLESRYDSLWVMLAQIQDTWVDLSVHTDIEVSRGGIDRFVFETAVGAPEFRAIGDQVREVVVTETDILRRYEVIFQEYLTSATSLTLEAELAHTDSIQLPDLAIPGADRQERYVILENRSVTQMDIQSQGVDKAVMSMLPYKPETILSAQLYRARPEWQMSIDLERLETSAGSDAIIQFAELTTAFRANGEEWLKAVYRMQNRSLQFLPIVADPKADLVSVTVAGTVVRADKGKIDGQDVLLIPLIQTEPGQLSYDVSVVFRKVGKRQSGTSDRLKRNLDDPTVLGMTVEKTMWKVHLPQGHELVDTGGNMQRVQAEDSAVAKLQSELDELKSLNWFSTSKSKVGDKRSQALGYDNGLALAERIESQLSQIDDNDNQELKKLKEELSQQRIVLTENRIEMPAFDTSQIASEPTESKTAWVSNAGDIKTRDQDNARAAEEQRTNVSSQLRLNDNISLGNNFFGESIGSNAESGKGASQADRAQSQISFFNKSNSSDEVQQKLSTLNLSQNNEQNDFAINYGKPIETLAVNRVSNARSAIQAEQPDLPKSAAGKPRSPRVFAGGGMVGRADPFGGGGEMHDDPFGGGDDDPFGSGGAMEPDPFGGGGGFGFESPSGAAAGGGTYYPSQALSAPLIPQGRYSIAVDFPVETAPIHFQKLKDHAELEISSKIQSSTGRGYWLLLICVLLGAIMGGRSLIVRFQ